MSRVKPRHPSPPATGDLLDRLEAAGPAFASSLRVLRSLGDTDAAARALPADLLAQGWVWDAAATAMTGQGEFESAVLAAAATYVLQALPGAEAATAAAAIAPLNTPRASAPDAYALQRVACAASSSSIGGSVALSVPAAAASSGGCPTGDVIFPPNTDRTVEYRPPLRVMHPSRSCLSDDSSALLWPISLLHSTTLLSSPHHQLAAVANGCTCPVLLEHPAEGSRGANENDPSGRGITGTQEATGSGGRTDSCTGCRLRGAGSLRLSPPTLPVQIRHGDSAMAVRQTLGDIANSMNLSVRSMAESDCQPVLELPLYAAPHCIAASQHCYQVSQLAGCQSRPALRVVQGVLWPRVRLLPVSDELKLHGTPAPCSVARDIDMIVTTGGASRASPGRPRLWFDNTQPGIVGTFADAPGSIVLIHSTASGVAVVASLGGEHDRVAQPDASQALPGSGSESSDVSLDAAHLDTVITQPVSPTPKSEARGYRANVGDGTGSMDSYWQEYVSAGRHAANCRVALADELMYADSDFEARSCQTELDDGGDTATGALDGLQTLIARAGNTAPGALLCRQSRSNSRTASASLSGTKNVASLRPQAPLAQSPPRLDDLRRSQSPWHVFAGRLESQDVVVPGPARHAGLPLILTAWAAAFGIGMLHLLRMIL